MLCNNFIFNGVCVKLLKNLIPVFLLMSFSIAQANDGSNLTNDPDHRAFVSKKINQELQRVNKKLIVTKITKITSEYDPSSEIYIMETDFKFKDPKGKIQSCSATVTTNGLNKRDDAASIPYVCFRIAGLG